MSNQKGEQIGRLALRVEGNMWNAYFAQANTMQDAILIGCVWLGAVESNEERKAAFIDLMKDTVADLIEHSIGTRPEMGDVHVGPEHERGGRA